MSPIIVADAAFLERSISESNRLLAVFPMTAGDGAYRSTLDGLLERSKCQSVFLSAFLPDLLKVWGKHFNLKSDLLAYVLRPYLLTITSLFIDRYVRIMHRLSQCVVGDIRVMSVEKMSCPVSLDDLHACSVSWHFNQEILQRIMVGLGYPEIMVLDAAQYLEYPRYPEVKNLVFRSRRSVSFFLKQFRVLLSSWNDSTIGNYMFSSLGLISAGMAYEDAYFRMEGFYNANYLRKLIPESVELIPLVADYGVRSKMLVALGDVVVKDKFLACLKPCIQESGDLRVPDAVYGIWAEMMVDFFPVNLLEGLMHNLQQTQKTLDRNAGAVIGAQLTSEKGLLLSIVAKERHDLVIGMTHSPGHYGYIEDFSSIAQFEYPLYDHLLTFGWTRIDDHLPQCKAIPVPSPRLSERPLSSDYTSNRNMAMKGKRDVLFLSNLFHRFPSVSTCGQARVDFIDEITDSQEKLMSALNESGCSVDHKPYHMRYVDLYPEHYRRLALAGGSTYRLIESTQKGLSVDLIKTAKIVLWDQIGSGTIDCFTSNVPTMVYWQRIYSREAPWAKDLVSELELCGVVHSSPETLVRELQIYLSDPKAWMADVRRLRAIEDFCYHFGRTDNNWAKIWRETLKSLVQHPPKHFVN